METPTKRFIALFLAVAILLIGHGLQLTLIPIRAQGLGWDASSIGITGSFYFGGFLLGCWLIPIFVARVGHIRVFSATTTLCCVALLLIAIWDNVAFWSLLRFGTGIGISGCYIVIESWLNAQTADESRGRTLAFYTALVLASMAVGQIMVNLDTPDSENLIIIGAVFLALAVVPVTLSRDEQPPAPPQVNFAFKTVVKQAPAAAGTVLFAGMMTGVLFTMTPVLTSSLGFTLFETSIALVVLVLGGAIFQFPAGRLSDHYDRRRVMVGLAIIGMIPAFLPLLMDLSVIAYLACLFGLGGVLNAFYPICLAHANDRYPLKFIEVGTVVLLTNSVGAVVGPTIAAVLMDLAGSLAYFSFVLILLLMIVVWLGWCIYRKTAPAEVEAKFVAVAKSSPAMLNFDPRGPDEDDIEQSKHEG